MAPLCNQVLVVMAIFINAVGQSCMIAILIRATMAELDNIDLQYAALRLSPLVLSTMVSSDVIGVTLSSVLMKYCGRKATYGVFIVPAITGWLLILCFETAHGLMMSEIFALGLSSGATNTLGSLIIGEYCSPNLRGFFLILKMFAGLFGMLFSVIAFIFLSLSTLAIVASVLLFIALILVCVWPESPHWLASKRRYGESEKAFFWLRGENEKKELDNILNIQKAIHSKPKSKSNIVKKAVKFFLRLTSSSFLEPLGIMVISNMLLELTGLNFILKYFMPLLRYISLVNHSPMDFSGIVFTILLASGIMSIALIKYVKRRNFLFCTGVPAFVTVLIVTFLFISRDFYTKHSVFPVVFLIIFIGLSNLCCAPLSMILVGEIFPLSYKGVGSVASKISSYLIKVTFDRLFPFMFNTIDIWGALISYSLIMFFCLFVLYVKLPETKDKTLLEIEKNFKPVMFEVEGNKRGSCLEMADEPSF